MARILSVLVLLGSFLLPLEALGQAAWREVNRWPNMPVTFAELSIPTWSSLVAVDPGWRVGVHLSWARVLTVTDLQTGHELLRLSVPAPWMKFGVPAVSSDGKLLAALRSDGRMLVWGIPSGAELFSADVSPGSAGGIALSPDGRLLAVAGFVEIAIWDLEGRQEARRVAVPRIADLVQFSPDGKLLAGTTLDRGIHLWDVASGTEVWSGYGHEKSVTCIAFSPDGRLLATGSADSTVRVWEVATGREVTTLVGHADAVMSLAFHPDGMALASGALDLTIRLWDLPAGEEALRIDLWEVLGPRVPHYDALKGERPDAPRRFWAPVHTLLFSPDGRALVSGVSAWVGAGYVWHGGDWHRAP